MTHVPMTKNGETWDSPEAFVPFAEKQGFKRVDAPAFNPGAHNVEAVLAHLTDADEAETARVLDAERAGKNRTSITGD